MSAWLITRGAGLHDAATKGQIVDILLERAWVDMPTINPTSGFMEVSAQPGASTDSPCRVILMA